MTDLSKMTTEELLALRNQAAGGDLSSMSTEELLALRGGAPQGGSAPYDPSKSLASAPGSAYEFGKAVVHPFLHPIQTAQTMSDLAGGGMNMLGADELNSWLADRGLAVRRNPEDVAREEGTAQAFGQHYKGRYGSWDAIKRTMETDPIGVAGDAATVLTGGSMATARIPGAVGRGTSKALGTAGNLVNPLTPVAGAGKVMGVAGKNVLGMTTGTSADTIGEAYKAGRTGGEYGKSFRRNMRGHEDQDVVIDQAREAMGNMKDAQQTQYQKDMRGIKADQTAIDFSPIERKFDELVNSAYEGTHQKASDQAIKKLNEIYDVLAEWQDDPAMHTAGGLDALKQRIDNLMPPLTDRTKDSVRYVTAVRNAVKDAIVQQAPEYAKAMKAYESSAIVQTELEKSLSLGKKASADTTLRKLQSVTRNNANTNYGSRAKNAKILEDAGAKTIMPSLAGQALNTWMPRGIRGPIAASALSGLGSFFSPLAAAGLLAGSPRLVGEAAHLAGRAGKAASRVPRPTRRGLLAARVLGNAGLLGSE